MLFLHVFSPFHHIDQKNGILLRPPCIIFNPILPFTMGMGSSFPEAFSERVVVNLQFGDLKLKGTREARYYARYMIEKIKVADACKRWQCGC